MAVAEQVRELDERRHVLRTEMRDILSGAESEDRDLTAEESQEFDRRQEEYDTLEQRGGRLKKMAEWEPEQPSARKVADQPSKGSLSIDEIRSRIDSGDLQPPKTLKEFNELRSSQRPQDDPDYRWAFYRMLTTRPGELSPDEMRTLSKATAAAGANLVPTDFQRTLIDALRDFGVVREIANVITTDSGDTLQMPSITSHGTASWTAENAAYTASDEVFGQFSLSAYKAATLMQVSEELVTDSAFDLEAFIRDQFGQRIGVLENTAYTVGTGTGQPAGWNNNATVGATAPTGNTTTIPADSIFDLVHSVQAAYRRGAVFVANDAGIKALRKIKDTTNQYLWSPGLVAGSPDQLLAYQIYTDPDVPAPAASARSLGFGNFKIGYTIRDVNGIMFQKLTELYAANGQVGFRAYHRTDGKIVNTAAIKVLVNSAT